jgi:hypothetical protein
MAHCQIQRWMGRIFWHKGILKPFSSTQKPLTEWKIQKPNHKFLNLSFGYKVLLTGC